MEDTYYINCCFDRSSIRAMAPGNARFESCSFEDVEILQFLAMSIEMVDCVISGVVRQAFFNGTVPADSVDSLGRELNEFHGNDFSRATLVDVGFRTGIDLARQKLPDDWQTET